MPLYKRAFLLFFILTNWSQAQSFSSSKEFNDENSEHKALVFLSASCPCSRSHVDHLNELAKQFKEFKVYGVITENPHESNQKLIESYYSPKNFKFPLILDESKNLLQKYRALKTPHVVLLKRNKKGDYQPIYEGGVSSHRQFSEKNTLFVKDNLVALTKKHPLPHRQGRSLGCYIRRL